MYRYLLIYVALLQVRTCFGESMVCVLSNAVKCDRSIETNQNSHSRSSMCDMTFNSNWTWPKCGTIEQGSDAIPSWFFIVMAAFQCGLLLVLAGCLLVGWKYVTLQPKREFVSNFAPEFVPRRGQYNDYTPDDEDYLQPAGNNQTKAPPCEAISVTNTEQETYDRVPVRVGSANKERRAMANIEPGRTATEASEEHYDFPSKVVRHV